MRPMVALVRRINLRETIPASEDSGMVIPDHAASMLGRWLNSIYFGEIERTA